MLSIFLSYLVFWGKYYLFYFSSLFMSADMQFLLGISFFYLTRKCLFNTACFILYIYIPLVNIFWLLFIFIIPFSIEPLLNLIRDAFLANTLFILDYRFFPSYLCSTSLFYLFLEDGFIEGKVVSLKSIRFLPIFFNLF